MTNEAPCLYCPLCGSIPLLIIGTRQAFCGNDDCLVFTWDMSASLDQNLTDARPVTITSSGPSEDSEDDQGSHGQRGEEAP